MEYIFVESHDPAKLSEMVTQLLKEGWQLYGSPTSAGTHSSTYAGQALTRDTGDTYVERLRKERDELKFILEGLEK